MSKIFIDTETCGFHGPSVLIQYAVEDGEIILYPVWERPVQETLDLLEYLADNEIIGFNLSFDWFHMVQLYTTLRLYKDRHPDYCDLIDVDLYAECEPDARTYCCLKPRAACDLMLIARQTKYQSLMDRNNIYIRKVPRQFAPLLRAYLNMTLPFNKIYFEKLQDHKKMGSWRIQDRKDPDFCNVFVKFAPSSRLKALAKDALGVEDPITLSRIALEDYYQPLEIGYAPYAAAVRSLKSWSKKGKKKFYGKWKGSWPDKIEHHIGYWGYHGRARKYASDDVDYTRRLWHYFDCPTPGDVDSDLACMVGAVRWHGFKIDLKGMIQLREDAKASKFHVDAHGNTRSVPTDSRIARRWLAEVMPPADRAALPASTDKEALLELMKWDHLPEVVRRATLISKARKADKEIEMYDKLILAERFHASFKVIGTLSSRMAGTDGLNAQGIKKAKYVRKCFPLAFEGMELCGGDFDGFEVTIADAVYNEPKLRAELQETVDCPFCLGLGGGTLVEEKYLDPETGNCKKCEGSGKEKKKIHATFGTFIFPGETYESIRLSDGDKEDDKYTISKSGLFVWLFAGTEWSFEKNLGVPSAQASKGLRAFENFYPNVGISRLEAMERYSPLSQEGGLGTQVFWNQKEDGVDTLLGFRRYFTLELETMKCLFDLAQNPPAEWKNIECGQVKRGDRLQTGIGATQTALYSAAFNIQSKIRRVAINHPIQGTGAQICKAVQHNIWTVQPHGAHPWMVLPMNVHDEIEAPCHPDVVELVKTRVNTTIKEFQEIVPLLSMEWKTGMKTWADK